MVSLIPEDVRKILREYTFEIDVDNINEDLTCIICDKLMVDAYQSYCGCKYCRECLIRYMNGKSTYCLGSKPECQEEQLVIEQNVFRSAVLSRKILKLRVHCPNNSCAVTSQLVNLMDHLRVCSKQPVKCPYLMIGCRNGDGTRDVVEAHLLSDLYTHSELIGEFLNNLKNEIGGLREDLEISKLKAFDMTEKDNKYSVSSVEIMERLNNQNVQSLKMLEEMEEQKVLVRHLAEQNVQMQEIVKGQEKTINEQSLKIMTLEDMLERYQSLDNLNNFKNKIEEMVSQLKIEIGTAIKNTRNGGVVYTIERFSVRKAKKDILYSPCFYSHTNGYKLRLEVHAGGNDDGKGTHLSIYFIICKGEYDDLLPWPCKNTVSIGIVNQRTGETHTIYHFSYFSVEDRFKRVFEKPYVKDNVGLGETTVISHCELLRIDGLVVDDSVVLTCVVTAL